MRRRIFALFCVQLNWYADSGATNHVTDDLNKLAMTDTYNGGEQIYTVSGSDIHIKHVGHAIICTPFVILNLIMSYMSLNHPRIFLPFTKLLRTTMSFF
jgi:hypothetical protein